MAIRDLFRRKQSPQSAPSRKTSATGPVVAYHSSGRVVWSARDTSSLTKTGYCGNLVGFRAVKLIAEAAADFTPISEEVSVPQTDQTAVHERELPIVMTRSEARETLEHWIATSRSSRESIQFSLPLSHRHLGVGDRFVFDDDLTEYRVDQVENGPDQIINAVRVDHTNFVSAPPIVEHSEIAPHVPSLPMHSVLIDCPNVTEDDIPHAPYVAVSADPWSGPVAVYASDGGQDYSQEVLIPNRSVIGRTTTAIVSKSSAIEDKGIGCVVEIGAGRLQSISQASAAAGYNLAVLGNPETQVWEVIQFLTAELVGPSRYRLRNIRWWLRGTDAERPDIWPEGTQFILLGLSRRKSHCARPTAITRAATALAQHPEGQWIHPITR